MYLEKRKKFFLTKISILLVLLINACSSTEEQESEADVYGYSNSNNGENNQTSTDDYSSNPFDGDNYSQADSSANTYENPYANPTAEINGYTEENYTNPYAEPETTGNALFSNENIKLEEGSNILANTAAETPINQTVDPLNQAMDNIATDPINTTNLSTEDESLAENQTGPAGPLVLTPAGGWVKYATTPLTATAEPGSGLTVRILEKGDHPLVIDEQSEYARLSNGSYVETVGLSATGVGRELEDQPWK